MTGIVIPGDRTTKQPITGYCFNPQCRETSDASRYEFVVEHDRFACPKCGATNPSCVGLLVLTHLLVADVTGPVIGSSGSRWRFACDGKRSILATDTNLEAATGMPEVANCPGCLAALAENDKHFRSPE